MTLETKDSSPGVRMVTVPDDRDGQRIDNFLIGQLKGVPKSLIYRILRTGQVRINDIANVATSFPGFDRLATGAGFALA